MKRESIESLAAHPLIAVAVLIAAPIGLYHWTQSSLPRQPAGDLALWSEGGEFDAKSSPDSGASSSPVVNAPGVRPTVLHPADVPGMYGRDQVFGVIVAGKARAYLVNAMCSVRECVVNDVVAGRPVSIVYSLQGGVARALTPSSRVAPEGLTAEPISLGAYGVIEGQLRISFNGRDYYYDEEIPGLSEYPFARCSWQVWKAAYPDTDLYTGDYPLDANGAYSLGE